MKVQFTKFALQASLVLGLACLANVARADTCQFIPASGAWNVPANWANCSAGNGIPAATPGPADRAEIAGGKVAVLPAGAFSVAELFLSDGTLQGAAIGATTLNTTTPVFTAWGGTSNTLVSLSLNLGVGYSMDSSSGLLTINGAELVTNSGTVVIGVVNISGTGARIQMTGGTAYHANGKHTMTAGGEFQNLSGVFKAISSLTIDGTFINGGNIEIPAGVTLSLADAAAMSQVNPVFSLIFGDGTLSAPGQTLTLATGGVRGGALTFNVGTLNNTGAVVRPAPAFGTTGALTINGNFVQSGSGLLDFNLAGIAPSQYDHIVVSGNVTLGGGLSRGAVGTFSPPVGTVLDIITAGSISGGFSSGSEAIVFDAPRRYIEVYSPTKVSLQANETVWVVGSTDDESPFQPSLRNALTRFNAESSSSCLNGPYSIHFSLSLGDTTITPATPLPTISGCPGLLIDGYQQAGAVPNTSATDWNANLVVTLNGASCAGCSGLTYTTANSVVKGINFTNWPDAAINLGGGSNGTRIEGNYFFQGNVGVLHIGGSQDVRIGQSGNAAARNVFVHAAQSGIHTTMHTGGLPLRIEGNLIGAGAGFASGPNDHGVTVNGSNGVILSGNYIANNPQGLVVLGGTGIDYSTNNAFVGNGIAVDLGDDGPSANDDLSPPYDTDMGPNQRLNFPKILGVTPTSATTANISYELRSNPSSNFQLCFCKNPSGGAQCEVPLTPCHAASTDASGFYTNTIGILGLSGGTMLTMFTQATSGPKSGNMSEISPGVAFAAPTCGNTEVTNTNDAGACSLRASITFANANCGLGPHTIAFNIPGAGPHLIQPLSALPAVTCNNTTIDGYTQPGSAVNSAAAGQTNADIRIRLDGALSGGTIALHYPKPVSGVIRGLSITNFNTGILALTSVNVLGNFIGVLPDGVTPAMNNVGVTAGADAVGGHCCIVVGTPAAADVNMLATNGDSVQFAGNVSGQVVNNLFGVDRNGNRVPGLGSNQGVGSYLSAPFNANNLQVRGNTFAYQNFVLGSQGGNVVFSRNSAALSNVQRSSSVVLYSQVELTRVVFDEAGTTRLEGNINAAAGGLHRVEVFSNPTPFGPRQTETYVADIDLNPTGAGLFPFGQTFASVLVNPSLTMTDMAGAATNSPTLYKRPFIVGAPPVGFSMIAGGSAHQQTVTVLNTLSTNLVFGAAPGAVTGSGFSIAGDTCAGATVLPGNNCTVQIAFSLAAAGSSNGVLTITATTVTENVTNGSVNTDTVYSTAVSGVATGAPAITVTGTTTFPPTTVGSSSAAQAITITNSGTATLTLNVITATNTNLFADTTSGPAPNSAHWCGFGSGTGGAPNTGAPINIAPAASCVLNMGFTPNAAGALASTIVITSNAPTSPTNIGLSGTGVAAATPTMTVAFAPGSVAPGVNSTMTLTLTNPSATPAFISGGSITIPAGLTATPPGSNSCGTFGSVSAGVYSFGMGNIPGSGSCTIALTVQSPTPGTYTATIMPGALTAGAGMNTNTSSSALTVTALVAQTISFAVAPASIVVNGIAVGTLTINNPNAIPLTANPVVFNYLPGLVNAPVPNASSTCAGANIVATPGAGSYTQTTPFTLPPSGSCTFSASITSSTPGVYSGNIMAGLIVTPAGSSNATPFSITVTAAPSPAVTLTPPSLNFGTRTVNTTSPVSSVTLSNSGTANLVISGITGSGDFGFTTTCPIATPPVVPAGSCVIDITFTPLTVAALTGSITITSNAPGSPHTIALSGSGSAVPVPGVGLSTTVLNYGNQTINTTASQSIKLTNTGFATLAISGITRTGSTTFNRISPASPSPDCGTSVAPGADCYITVTFTPTATGAVTGQIHIASNAGGSPHLVTLNGSGVSAAIPGISVAGSVVFGDQILTTGGVQTLTIGSSGSGALNISGITLSGTDAASFVPGLNCTISIAAGANCSLTITFTPTSTGAKTAQLVITSDAVGQPSISVTLSGNGILAPRPIVELSATAIGYGNAIFGGATASQVVTLKNTGGATLAIQSLVTVGDFVQMSSCGGSVASGASCVINVMFSPLGIGSRTGELRLGSNADGSPHRVFLSGTGCRWFSQVTSRFFLTQCGN